MKFLKIRKGIAVAMALSMLSAFPAFAGWQYSVGGPGTAYWTNTETGEKRQVTAGTAAPDGTAAPSVTVKADTSTPALSAVEIANQAAAAAAKARGSNTAADTAEGSVTAGAYTAPAAGSSSAGTQAAGTQSAQAAAAANAKLTAGGQSTGTAAGTGGIQAGSYTGPGGSAAAAGTKGTASSGTGTAVQQGSTATTGTASAAATGTLPSTGNANVETAGTLTSIGSADTGTPGTQQAANTGNTAGQAGAAQTAQTAQAAQGTKTESAAQSEGGKVMSNGRYVDPAKPMVALTYDDGPYAAVGNIIMDECAKVNGRVTFFMVGNRVGNYASEVKRMAAEGHELGNHSYDHALFNHLGGAQIQAEVAKCNQAIANVSGVTPTIMRLTGGNITNTVRKNVSMPMIYWSIDTLDWKTRNAQSTINAVVGKVKDGDIVLMHEIQKSSGEAAKTIIPELAKKGFQLVTVSELARFKGATLSGGNGKQYSRF